MLHTILSMFYQFNKIGICATTESTSKLNKNIYSSRGSHLFKNLYSISDLSKVCFPLTLFLYRLTMMRF